MVLFTRNVKKIKGAAHKNSDVDGTCKKALSLYRDQCVNFYRPQSSCGKIMFLHVSVILSRGRVWQGRQTPPWLADTPPPKGRPLQRNVRILLECILVATILIKECVSNPLLSVSGHTRQVSL